MSELVLDANAPSRARVNGNWIVSAPFDSALLIFAPLATIPIVLMYVGGVRLWGNMLVLMLAFAHYMSTTAFYFWDDSVKYHRVRWLAFYAGPVILAAIYFLLIAYHVPYVIQFALFFWNTFHVARQNCGVVSIYRNRAGVRDDAQRDAANRAILAVSAFLAVWNIGTHEEVNALFRWITPNFGDFVRFALGIVAAISIIGLIRALILRKRAGQPLPVPEILLIITSIVFFYPYLVIKSSIVATGAMLIPHYVQYMAIVWLLHRRKFGASSASGAPSVLRRLSSNTALLIPALGFVGFSFYVMYWGAAHFAIPQHFETFYLLIAFEHFYLDGLIWSFKQPHVRQTIGPYLMRPAPTG